MLFMKPEQKNPISRYKIDRLTLTNSGIPKDKVDRIYKALFVYSIGFYEMLSECLLHSNNKYLMLANIWKVFAILLESCCKSNYQMFISKLSEEHKDELEKIEQQFNEHINRLTENERSLKESLEQVEKKKEELQKQKEEEIFLRKKVEEEFTKNVQTQEEEVQLRMKFESKLNNMHALHRDLQAKYSRSLEDIYQLENQNHVFSKLISDQKAELIVLRSERVENESKVAYQIERIKQLIQENEQKLRLLNDSELKICQANNTIEQITFSLKIAEKQVNEMRLKIDANKSIIENLTSDKNHLELSLKENKDQKEQFKEKCDRVQKMYEEVLQQMLDYKKQLVGIQEIKKDRDDRIEKLRNEYELLSKNYDNLDKDNTILKLKLEHDQLSEKLRISNKMRNETDENLNEKIKQIDILEHTIVDRDNSIERLKKDLDKVQKRISEVERENDSLEIKKKSLDKQSEIQRRQLLDKIQSLNELVAAEKDTREMWINRYEKEQQALFEFRNKSISLASQNYQNQEQEDAIQHMERAQYLTDQNNDLQNQLTDFLAKNETLERDLYIKTELLKVVEQQNRSSNSKLKEEINKLTEQKKYQVYCKAIEYEDLRSHTRKLYEKNVTLADSIKLLTEQLALTNSNKLRVQNDLAKLQEQHVNLQNVLETKEEQLNKSIEKCQELDYQVQQQNRQIDSMREEIGQLVIQIEELKPSLEQNKSMQGENSILENLESEQQIDDSEQIKRNRKTLVNRGLQTKKIKQKEKNIQTDAVPLLQPQMHISTTQVSTNKNSVASQKQTRIVSAANTRSTFGMSGNYLMREQSQGLSSTLGNSQGDLNFQEGVNLGGGVNFFEYDRVIRSAVHKYRHMIPGAQAIQEESGENVVGMGMFKRNVHVHEGNESQLRKIKTNCYIQENNGEITNDPNQKIITAQNYRTDSRQNLRVMNNIADNGDQEYIQGHSSNQSSQRSSFKKNALRQEALKSMYDKRVATAGLHRSGFGSLQTHQRPISQPGQNRTMSVLNQTIANNRGIENIHHIFTPTDNQFKQRLDNQEYQNKLHQHSSMLIRKSSKSKNKKVKGGPSIRTLIKVAASRDN